MFRKGSRSASPLDRKDTTVRFPSPTRSPVPASGCPSLHFSSSESRHSSPWSNSPNLGLYYHFSAEISTHNCEFHIDTCKRCGGTDLTSLTEEEFDGHSMSLTMSRAGEDFSHRRSVALCSSIRSRVSLDVSKMQLKEELLRLYFPAGISDLETDFMYSKFLAEESLQSLSGTMRAAIDTLGLVQLGIRYCDNGLLREAQERYQAAVTALNRDLENSTAMYDDAVLGAIYLLGFCEVFETLSQGAMSRTHHRGLQDLLLARGPKRDYSKFAQLLVYNFRHLSAMVGCRERKSVPFAKREWRQCSAITDGLTTGLSEQLLIIPGALERADKATERPGQEVTKLFNVLLELTSLEQRMQAWLLQWYSSFEHQPYWLTDLRKFEHFQRHYGSAPVVFSKALQFPSFSVASLQVAYWIGLIQLKQTIYEINRAHERPIMPKFETAMIAECEECADRLCESIAWLSQPQYGFCGVMQSMDLLHYAFRWYRSQGNLEKMAWCEKTGSSMRAVASMTSLFGVVSPTSPSSSPQPPLLLSSPSFSSSLSRTVRGGTYGVSEMAKEDAGSESDDTERSMSP